MKTKPDPFFDHALAVTFTGISDPIERVRFYRQNKVAIGREETRVREGRPLPQQFTAKVDPVKPGLTVRRNGVVMRHIPSRGLFGQ